jgi:hypothetical protein
MARKIPISGLPLLAYKLRTGGWAWLSDRVRREATLPTTGAGQAFYRAARALSGGRRRGTPAAGDTLFAFYDLAVAPVTFDFLWFLVGADLARGKAGLASVHVVIVPGRDAGLRQEDPAYESAVDAETRRARIGNILIPACSFLPSLGGITVAGTRGEAERLIEREAAAVYPERYEPALPAYPNSSGPLRLAREEGLALGVLRATAPDLRAVDRWLAAHSRGRPAVTITLRHYRYMAGRNSNLAGWTDFARRLDQRFVPVFVPDTEQCLDGLPQELAEFPTFPEAALNLGLRMALYESAHLNLGVNNGPMGLCWLNQRTRYITFKMLTDSAPQTTPEYMRHLGFDIGASLPGASPGQKWVWEDDDLTVIEREFAAMAARLEPGVGGPMATPAPDGRGPAAARLA